MANNGFFILSDPDCLSGKMKMANVVKNKSSNKIKETVTSIRQQRTKSFNTMSKNQTDFLGKQSRLLPFISESNSGKMNESTLSSSFPGVGFLKNPMSLQLPEISKTPSPLTATASPQKSVLLTPRERAESWRSVLSDGNRQKTRPRARKKPILDENKNEFTGPRPRRGSTLTRQKLARHHWRLIRKNLQHLIRLGRKELMIAQNDKLYKDLRRCRYLRHTTQQMDEISASMGEESESVGRHSENCFCTMCTVTKHWKSLSIYQIAEREKNKMNNYPKPNQTKNEPMSHKSTWSK